MARFRLLAFFVFFALVSVGFAETGVHGDQDPNAPSLIAAPNLSGTWDVQEEERSYQATLNREGNGTYTWQGGRITTTEVADRKWRGTWHQPGNDREGGFELLLDEDGMGAKGVWWYTRVGDRKNIPPKQWGGSYVWKRRDGAATSDAHH